MGQLKIGPLDARSMPADTTSQVVSLINKVYTGAEDGVWQAGWTRTSAAEISPLIHVGEIIAAYQDTALVGVIRLLNKIGHGGHEVGEFGLLAVEPNQRGTGVGRELVQYTERVTRERGIKVMQLEILVPKHWKLASKEFLLKWYGRLGYKRVGLGQLKESLVPFLATETDYIIFQKAL